MGIAYNTSIVRDGLVLHLDAANVKSYPGSGTTWDDVSGNGNDGTLTNGPTYSSDNKGSIVFDGTNDYVNCGSVTMPSNTFSIEVTFSWDDYNTTNIGFLVAGNNEQLEIHTGGDSGTNGLRVIPYNYPDNSVIDASNIISSGINHITVISPHTSATKIYKNGGLFASSSSGSGISLNSTQTFNIGRRTNGSYLFDGKIHNVKLYNRALTEDEIKKNFEATRGRYGI